MPQRVVKEKTFFTPIVVGVIVLLGLVGAFLYLHKPAPTVSPKVASDEAKAYLPNLALSDVSMQATENFMKQRVIEVNGKITNKGNRPLRSIDVYCLFYGVTGQEIHRELLPIVNAKNAPLPAGETRPFRLPFDAVPDGWNQVMPKMVVAEIKFAQ